MKKLVIGVFLSVALCLGMAVSSLAMKYKEAPMLKVKVAAGELPPVEERLPDEPRVIEVPEIGTYGSYWTTQKSWTTTGMFWLWEHLFVTDIDQVTPVGNIIKAWEFNEDATECTWYMRKGMKWSDGYPFTADDIMYWYESEMLNTDLWPKGFGWLTVGGEMATLEKIDDYTVKWAFAAPYGFFIDVLVTGAGYHISKPKPKHYSKQFHPDYTPMEEIEKMMEEEGFENWMRLYNYYCPANALGSNPEYPSLQAWVVLNNPGDPIHYAERNPYYFKVDQEGNQLPYIDGVKNIYVANAEAAVLGLIAGKADIQHIGRIGGTPNYTLLMLNRETANYRRIGMSGESNTGTIFLNPSQEDPVLRELFTNFKFRQALSVAINREELNQLVFSGMGWPSQVAPNAGPPFYGENEEWKDYTQYDPELANRLLDEIGLSQRDKNGYRLRSDGETLFLVISSLIGYPAEGVEMAEFYSKYWDEVGIQNLNKPLADALFAERFMAGQGEVYVRSSYFNTDPFSRYTYPVHNSYYPAALWGLWGATDGLEGEEPDANTKRLLAISKEIVAEPSLEKRIALFLEAFRSHGDNLLEIGVLQIGGVDSPGNSMFVSNRLANVRGSLGAFYLCEISSWFIEPEYQKGREWTTPLLK